MKRPRATARLFAVAVVGALLAAACARPAAGGGAAPGADRCLQEHEPCVADRDCCSMWCANRWCERREP